MRGNKKKNKKKTSQWSNNNESHMSIKDVFSSIVHSRYVYLRVYKCMQQMYRKKSHCCCD